MSVTQMSRSTAATLSRPAPHAIGGDRWFDWVLVRAMAFMTKLEHRRAVADLMSIDDRMLKDIGIDRAGIKWAVMAEIREPKTKQRSRRSA